MWHIGTMPITRLLCHRNAVIADVETVFYFNILSCWQSVARNSTTCVICDYKCAFVRNLFLAVLSRKVIDFFLPGECGDAVEFSQCSNQSDEPFVLRCAEVSAQKSDSKKTETRSSEWQSFGSSNSQQRSTSSYSYPYASAPATTSSEMSGSVIYLFSYLLYNITEYSNICEDTQNIKDIKKKQNTKEKHLKN